MLSFDALHCTIRTKHVCFSSTKNIFPTHRKCARVVGEVLGKFHPHGDTAVYDALVRMAQGFSMRAPLVDGHGNFGSLDDDPPAAMRYTECRLMPLAAASLLEDLDSETVNFLPNFDASTVRYLMAMVRFVHTLIDLCLNSCNHHYSLNPQSCQRSFPIC